MKKQSATGKKGKKKAAKSPHGRGLSTSPKKSAKPSGKVAALSKKKPKRPSPPPKRPRTQASPNKPKRRGSNVIKGRVKVSNQELGRPDPALIQEWCAKRRNVEFWRNRDGSYEALVTWKGKTAYEQLRRAVKRMPGRPYMQVRFFTREELGQEDHGSRVTKVRIGDGPIWLRVASTPTVRGPTPNDGINYALSWLADDPRLYYKRAGLSVLWAPPIKKGK